MSTQAHDAWLVREHGPIETPDVRRLIVAHEQVAQSAEARAALKQAATYLHA
jgi:hypothetical protein